ncbi:hypothetical protein FRC08_009633 [Ceratobasidium sp. 394]|nr:hypothetical protein FRC08_009633 [Ceratobasidium sp. 394]
MNILIALLFAQARSIHPGAYPASVLLSLVDKHRRPLRQMIYSRRRWIYHPYLSRPGKRPIITLRPIPVFLDPSSIELVLGETVPGIRLYFRFPRNGRDGLEGTLDGTEVEPRMQYDYPTLKR